LIIGARVDEFQRRWSTVLENGKEWVTRGGFLKKAFVVTSIKTWTALVREKGRSDCKYLTGREGVVVIGGEGSIKVVEKIINEIFSSRGVDGHIVRKRLKGAHGCSGNEDGVEHGVVNTVRIVGYGHKTATVGVIERKNVLVPKIAIVLEKSRS
jgi:hypothetical protein